ncbi:hypothetical protein ACFVAD_22465 [Sutcliffiella sp. NPDC057660]|uniref:hypothetical protein n=1 Tax=Sutcliffiella sp. NPDC057660 TaxID=3346199 RepID=UPI0036C44794
MALVILVIDLGSPLLIVVQGMRLLENASIFCMRCIAPEAAMDKRMPGTEINRVFKGYTLFSGKHFTLNETSIV